MAYGAAVGSGDLCILRDIPCVSCSAPCVTLSRDHCLSFKDLSAYWALLACSQTGFRAAGFYSRYHFFSMSDLCSSLMSSAEFFSADRAVYDLIIAALSLTCSCNLILYDSLSFDMAVRIWFSFSNECYVVLVCICLCCWTPYSAYNQTCRTVLESICSYLSHARRDGNFCQIAADIKCSCIYSCHTFRYRNAGEASTTIERSFSNSFYVFRNRYLCQSGA